MGVIRVVLVRFREGQRTDEGRTTVVAAAREVFPTIPGVVDFEAGVASPGDAWDVVLLVHFAAASDVEPYRVHPIHVQFVDGVLKPRMERLEARNFTT